MDIRCIQNFSNIKDIELIADGDPFMDTYERWASYSGASSIISEPKLQLHSNNRPVQLFQVILKHKDTGEILILFEIGGVRYVAQSSTVEADVHRDYAHDFKHIGFWVYTDAPVDNHQPKNPYMRAFDK